MVIYSEYWIFAASSGSLTWPLVIIKHSMSESSRALTALLTRNYDILNSFAPLLDWKRSTVILSASDVHQSVDRVDLIHMWNIYRRYPRLGIIGEKLPCNNLSHLETILIWLSDEGITLIPNKWKVWLEEVVRNSRRNLNRSGLLFSVRRENIVKFKLPLFSWVNKYFREHS